MKPLNVVYWSKVGLGALAALLCALLPLDSFLSGLSFGLLFYILTYYMFKGLFATKVEDTGELFKMGIGAYFLSWIVAWVLFYTLLVVHLGIR
ncbi:hypothetical protein GWN63_04090 [Candidatus Bathyarchaeota archaeon]|nr:hypothetical protein [Candidatus Bathyarchaeota archaeon]NIU81410.1 hypothetical protein [Candidatus Bathyarchaeota archaeon]NIV68027.1 hypothetical protein [Candidatus Bathyarchaeota archaeon]NIW15909.1 hypothetical protein [Candidatus Bathyarchaeota archaeon]